MNFHNPFAHKSDNTAANVVPEQPIAEAQQLTDETNQVISPSIITPISPSQEVPAGDPTPNETEPSVVIPTEVAPDVPQPAPEETAAPEQPFGSEVPAPVISDFLNPVEPEATVQSSENLTPPTDNAQQAPESVQQPATPDQSFEGPVAVPVIEEPAIGAPAEVTTEPEFVQPLPEVTEPLPEATTETKTEEDADPAATPPQV